MSSLVRANPEFAYFNWSKDPVDEGETGWFWSSKSGTNFNYWLRAMELTFCLLTVIAAFDPLVVTIVFSVCICIMTLYLCRHPSFKDYRANALQGSSFATSFYTNMMALSVILASQYNFQLTISYGVGLLFVMPLSYFIFRDCVFRIQHADESTADMGATRDQGQIERKIDIDEEQAWAAWAASDLGQPLLRNRTN